MKRILLVILSLLIYIPICSALEINQLGFKMDMPEGYTPITRESIGEDKYKYLTKMYKNDIYLQTEDNKDQIIYLRAIKNPGLQDYVTNADLLSDVLGLGKNINGSLYNYIEGNGLKWIKYEYKDEKTEKELIDYYMSYKDLFITITIQPKDKKINENDVYALDSMVGTASLTGEGQAELNPIYEDGMDPLNRGGFNIPLLTIFCVLSIILTWWITRRKK